MTDAEKMMQLMMAIELTKTMLSSAIQESKK